MAFEGSEGQELYLRPLKFQARSDLWGLGAGPGTGPCPRPGPGSWSWTWFWSGPWPEAPFG